MTAPARAKAARTAERTESAARRGAARLADREREAVAETGTGTRRRRADATEPTRERRARKGATTDRRARRDTAEPRRASGSAGAATGRRRAEREAAAARIAERAAGGRRRRAGDEATSARATRSATATVEAPPRPAPERVAPKPAERRRSNSPAAQRAFARRAHREGRRPEPLDGDEDRTAGRASFVVLIIALLAVGVAATLWLSTQAIADSYRLEEAKERAGELAERAAELQRDVTKAESASELARRAKAMGMVPAGHPARLVVQPDGRVVVVGEPTRAEKPKPPKPADEQSRQQAGATQGDG